MNLYRLNLNLLIALDSLLLEKSVTFSAKKLFITQAAMSNNLRQLREIFKDELLIREKNRMVLTQYAKELQPKLHQVLQEIHSLIISGQQFHPETSERVFKLAMPDYMATILLPELTARLKQKAPHVKIIVISLYHLSSTEAFEKGEYDLGLGKLIELGSAVHKEIFFEDKGVMIMNKNHPLSKKKTVTLQDYLSQKHVAMFSDNPHFPHIIEQALRSLGYQRDVQVGLPFIIPIFKLIEQSPHLIGSMISSMAKLYKKNYEFVIKPLPFNMPPIQFHIAWHQRSENDLGIKWLREEIMNIGSKFNAKF